MPRSSESPHGTGGGLEFRELAFEITHALLTHNDMYVYSQLPYVCACVYVYYVYLYIYIHNQFYNLVLTYIMP